MNPNNVHRLVNQISFYLHIITYIIIDVCNLFESSLKRIVSSPWLSLFCIVVLFVWIGSWLIKDMTREQNMAENSTHGQHTKSSDPDQMDPVRIDINQYNNNKPLRIILTIATNIDPQRTYLFLSSYRRWHPVQDQESNKIYQLYMFTQFSQEKYLKELQRMADFFEIALVDMEPIETELDEKYLDILKINMKWIKINKRRFFVLFHWLQQFENTADIDTIFLSDANDVKFQVFPLLILWCYPCTQYNA